MSRQERQQSATGIYHVMLRGINKQWIMSARLCRFALQRTVPKFEGRTRYDGLEPFNQEVKVPLQIPNSYNKFVISIAGEHSSLIKNVRVSVNDGITWDWELPLNLDTYWFYQLNKTY